jgi:hypothetical protein
MPAADGSMTVAECFGGRALLLRDGAIYAGRRYAIYRSADSGTSWTHVGRLPCSPARRMAQWSRLACRLLRHEIRAMNVLSTGGLVACNREGVFHGPPDGNVLQPSRVDQSAKPLAPPMSLAVGPADRVLFGEYDSSPVRRLVRLYVSDDGGRSFDVARTFPKGEILHVHGLLWDARLGQYWLLSGDHEHEPGIGLLSADLRDFQWVAKGRQVYRAVEVFDFGDRLIYGTDSEKEPNAIVSFDKVSGRIERLVEIEGSCIYSCRFGGWFALTTTVEPSVVNRGQHAGLWLSRDGSNWKRVLEARKDRWHARYFQYGSLVLPRGAGRDDTVFFSGQALRGFDGRLWRGSPPPVV